MTPTETLILGAYFFLLIILALYGWHRYFLVYLYMKHKGDKVATPVVPETWPAVTVQLPLYNEMYVVDRLVEAVCRIDYPKDRLEIQVLDDSNDETQDIARLAVQRYAAQGFDIKYIHRDDRLGYKAGALEAIVAVNVLDVEALRRHSAARRDGRCPGSRRWNRRGPGFRGDPSGSPSGTPPRRGGPRPVSYTHLT